MLAVVQAEELRLGQRRLDRDARRPDALRKERGGDVRALAAALAAIKRGDDRRVQADRRRIVAAPSHRPGRRRARMGRHRQQAAARPVRSDIEAGQIGVRPLLAEAGDVRIDEARVQGRNVVVFELQAPARRVRRIEDEDVGPLDQPLDHRSGGRRLEIERYAALVAVGEVPGIRLLRHRLRRHVVRPAPEVAGGGLDLDHVGAEVGEDHGGARPGDEARQVHHLESGKDVVAHGYLPWNSGTRFARKAEGPSRFSSVAAPTAEYAASSAEPSPWPASSPLFTASRASLTAIGALAAICARIASARAISSAAGTISLTRPMRCASSAPIVAPERMSCSARPLPTRRGRRCVPPPPGSNPSLTSGWPNLAVGVASLRVQAIAVSQPPPRAKPLMAATTGLPRFSIRSSTPCPKRLDSCASKAPEIASSPMSAPAMKARSPPPVRITPRTSASSRASWNAVARSAQVGVLSALSTLGRSSVTYATAPFFS